MIIICFLFLFILLDPPGFSCTIPINRVAVLFLQDPILNWCSLDNISRLPAIHVDLAILVEYF